MIKSGKRKVELTGLFIRHFRMDQEDLLNNRKIMLNDGFDILFE